MPSASNETPTPNNENDFSKWKNGGTSYQNAVILSIMIFWVVVSLIPVYIKHFFENSLYPYPIGTAGIQLSIATIFLAMFNIARHYWLMSSEGADSVRVRRYSWIFGPHLLWKLRLVFPIGVLFGLKFGVTNLGLHLVPAPTHLLLQSTDIIWVVLWARVVNAERVTRLGFFCVLGCVIGSICLGIRVGQHVQAPLLAIAVNLASPMLMGLCVATLRMACKELMDPGNRRQIVVGSVELSTLKLIISSLVAFGLAYTFEGGDEDNNSFYKAFFLLPRSTKLGVAGGSILVLIFQVNCTFLIFLTSTVTVGLVGQLKIIPQWAVASILLPGVTKFEGMGILNLMGASLTILSAAGFVLDKWHRMNNHASSDRIRSDSSLVSDTSSDSEARRSNFETQPLIGEPQQKKQLYSDDCHNRLAVDERGSSTWTFSELIF